MNKLLIALCGTGLLFAACKEKAPNINFGTGLVIDTTYVVSPVPAAQPHNVLMEEFTGASCTNCPAAHETLLALEAAHPGRLNVVGLYIKDILQTSPPNGSTNDFRDDVASGIGKDVYLGINTLPNGGIDRAVINGSIQVPQGNWSSAIVDKMNAATPLNLEVTSSYNATTGEDTITATVTYTQTVAIQHNLSIVITEDSIIDRQEFPFNSPYPDNVNDAYVFTNVFRGMVTLPSFGDAILPAMTSKEAGRVYRHTYIYKPKAGVKPEHARVIAFVNSAVDKTVIQSTETKMKP